MHYERRGLMQPLQRETTAGPACRRRWVRSVVIACARACAASMAEAKYSLSQCYYFEVTSIKSIGHHGNRAPGKCRHCRHTATMLSLAPTARSRTAVDLANSKALLMAIPYCAELEWRATCPRCAEQHTCGFQTECGGVRITQEEFVIKRQVRQALMQRRARDAKRMKVEVVAERAAAIYGPHRT